MKLGKLSFDLPDYGHDGLVLARNVYPSLGGYKPFRDLSAATGNLGAEWVGGGAFSYGGTNVMLGATAAKLRSHASGAWSDEYTVATTQPWFFGQFGNNVVCVNGGAPVKYDIGAGTASALGGSPPSASYVAIADDFVVLSGNASDDQTVYWSEINDSEGWTIGTNECDSQIIPDGGSITGLSGGNKYFLVFQRSAINIFERTSDPTLVFTRREVSRSVGCVAHGSIARWEDRHFFLSAGGFCMWEAGQVIPIGENAVDFEFLENYTQSEIETYIRASVDEQRKLVIWSMPGRLFIYHWPTQQWSDVIISGLIGITMGTTASATLDDIAAIYPSIEDVTPDLDDAYWRGGTPMLLYAKSDNILYTSSGDNLEATFKLARNEMFPGRWAHIRSTEVGTDATDGLTVHIDTSMTRGGSQERVSSSDLRDNGEIPIIASGRFIQSSIVIEAGAEWSYCLEFAAEGTPGGRL